MHMRAIEMYVDGGTNLKVFLLILSSFNTDETGILHKVLNQIIRNSWSLWCLDPEF